jgi:hypothetical protein
MNPYRGHKNCIIINKIRNEKVDITTEHKYIQNIIKSYYKWLFSTKLGDLDEMNKFLDRYQLPKLKQDQINDLNSTMSPKELEAVINVLLTKTKKPKTNKTIQKKKKKKKTGTDGFSAEFYQTFKEELITILLKLCHKIEAESILPHSLYEDTITPIPKPHKDPKKKENFDQFPLWISIKRYSINFSQTETKNMSNDHPS